MPDTNIIDSQDLHENPNNERLGPIIHGPSQHEQAMNFEDETALKKSPMIPRVKKCLNLLDYKNIKEFKQEQWDFEDEGIDELCDGFRINTGRDFQNRQ